VAPSSCGCRSPLMLFKQRFKQPIRHKKERAAAQLPGEAHHCFLAALAASPRSVPVCLCNTFSAVAVDTQGLLVTQQQKKNLIWAHQQIQNGRTGMKRHANQAGECVLSFMLGSFLSPAAASPHCQAGTKQVASHCGRGGRRLCLQLLHLSRGLPLKWGTRLALTASKPASCTLCALHCSIRSSTQRSVHCCILLKLPGCVMPTWGWGFGHVQWQDSSSSRLSASTPPCSLPSCSPSPACPLSRDRVWGAEACLCCCF
jgi:hypothetical protein